MVKGQADLKAIVADFESLMLNTRVALIDMHGRVLAGDDNIQAIAGTIGPMLTGLSPAEDSDTPSVNGWALHPFWMAGQCIGALAVSGEERAPLTQSLYRTLNMLFKQNYEKRQVVRETLSRYRELSTLHTVGKTIGACLHTSELPELLLKEVSDVVSLDVGFVLLKTTDGTFDMKASVGDTKDVAFLKRAAYDVIMSVTERNEPAIVTDVPAIMGVVLGVPLSMADSSWGVMVLGRYPGKPEFVAGEEKMAVALAEHTAIALENARLLEQAQTMSASLQRLNTELQAAYERLKDVDRLKSSFIGVITHELRSPFVAASFSVQLLQRFAEREMYQEVNDQIAQIDRELREGRQMIDTVIAFASLMSKQGELQLMETDVPALIEQAVAPLKPMAAARDITMTFSFDENLPIIFADKERLGQAIYHLVHNAIKFNFEEGQVDVSCRLTGGEILFMVKDNGRGIPPEKLPTIWDAFSQAADDVKRGVAGLGLGLPLVKFVIEGHGGEVMAQSQEYRGSTVGFRLPL